MTTLLVLVLLLSYGALGILGFDEDEDWSREKEESRERRREEEREEEGEEPPFLLKESKHVMRTDAGEMRVVSTSGSRFMEGPMRVGFITMEPKTLFLPQYLDSDLIIFIRRGIL